MPTLNSLTNTSAFSSSGEDAITRVLDVQKDTATHSLSQAQFDDYYEIQRTTSEIVNGDFKRIALQFPDELLHDSVPIYRRLSSLVGSGRELYVLADTSYGSCCVDEVAAQHVDAELIIHYGHACMSQHSRLPVLYVFGRKNIDVETVVDGLVDVYLADHPIYASSQGVLLKQMAEPEEEKRSDTETVVVLRHDVVYTHQAQNILNRLQAAFARYNIHVSYTPIPTRVNPPSTSSDPSQITQPRHEPDSSTMFYIGGESLSLTNLLITHSASEVYTSDPQQPPRPGINPRLESGRTNKLLMRRYAILQRARDADVFGILVGTLGIASYLPLLTHLRTLLKRKHKKSYTISVGKLNPSKLANFMEIECFVLVACPENSLIDSKGFLRPIVTPYELEVALRAEQSWTGRYVLDFEQVLRDTLQLRLSDGADEDVEDSEDPDKPVFSLITGTYRHAKRFRVRQQTAGAEVQETAMVLRNPDTAMVMKDSAAGQFLNDRSFKGLEVRLGEDMPSLIEQGRSGIARGYDEG
ncbi:diphthamide biosynthesis protein [Pluteus cervinus]|uniref:Diphthamide biosynthesis protein n=1 Tax=Pluteus cervinus TaxID=181527 RepID=A0ACD3AP81_9AGAR|nr:diphthamide biosynthesis protein [Pluteus cervinus]